MNDLAHKSSPAPRRMAAARRPIARPAAQNIAPAQDTPRALIAAPAARPAQVEASVEMERPHLEFENMASTGMFDTLSRFRVVAPGESSVELAATGQSLRERRGYTQDEIYALAEMGYHYFRCGGFKLARVIFEGLAAIEPKEPYFAIALGLVADHLGERDEAVRCYVRATKLDPGEPRADINLAELALEAKNRTRAVALLRSGAEKARARGIEELENKALALLELINDRAQEVRR